MTEFEQRLTDEFSKLAEQYAQEQKQLSAQVESLGKQCGSWPGSTLRSRRNTPNGSESWAYVSRP